MTEENVTGASPTTAADAGTKPKRTLTDEEKRKLLAAKRRQKVLQRGNAFLKDPENALNKSTDAGEANHTPVKASASPPPPFSTSIYHNNTAGQHDNELHDFPTVSTPGLSSSVNTVLFASPSTMDTPRTPKTPETPEESSPTMDANTPQPTLRLNQGSPLSPNVDLMTPLVHLYKSQMNNNQRRVLQETESLIPDEEEEEGEEQYSSTSNDNSHNINKETRGRLIDANQSHVPSDHHSSMRNNERQKHQQHQQMDQQSVQKQLSEDSAVLATSGEDKLTRFMQKLRMVLIVLLSVYSAVYACFAPCDTIAQSYLHSNNELFASENVNSNTWMGHNHCPQRAAKSLMNFEWKEISIKDVSTWPYLPPLTLFVTIQLIVIVPRLIRYITVKKNKNGQSMLDMFLFALQMYGRVRRLLREICLFIFTYVMVVISLKFAATQVGFQVSSSTL